ncbi:hypothetical protein NLJ89_g3699 [Agrocybe chaxingu]|uniref:MFS general substrate transporter n=1 Tax=Agrocybe chaxingu TaxID=84603 RepID=A0A9W8MWM6_9AGAR|nr:hypothetical protein NLJ89_g3699 [Agrocybe chaxingu]
MVHETRHSVDATSESRLSHDITVEEHGAPSLHPSDIVERLSVDKEKYDVVEVAVSPVQGDGEFPDGGLKAWLIVCGAMCNTFATFGYVNSWGIFQNYYQETLLSSSPPSSMYVQDAPFSKGSLISFMKSMDRFDSGMDLRFFHLMAFFNVTLQYALVFLPGLVVGRFFDLGYFRSIFLTSSTILVVATFLVAECKEYWHFVLCQGIMVGLGCGGIFGPTAAVVAHWFKKRRGLAMGFVAVGSSIGGTVLPIAAKGLIPTVGFKWTMRIFGFILMAVLGASNLLLERRLPPRHVEGGLLNLRAFRSAAYSVYCVSAFVTFLGVYTVLTYVGVSATSIGISTDFAFYFVAIANAASLVGRYCAGVVCDRVGAYVSLLSNPTMDMGETGDVGRRIGMFMSILAMGALAGPPISGAISSATGDFKAVGYYAGTSVLVGVGLMSVTRHLILRRMFGRI